MAKKSRNMRRSKKSRNMKGGAYSFGHAVAPEAPYAQEVLGGTKLTPDCLDATRPGLTTANPGGLPGFAGGGSTSLANKLLYGGRYTFDLGAGPINGIGSAGASAGMAVVNRIGCEGGLVDTSPPGAHANPIVLQGGAMDTNQAYIAPTAGYTNTSSSFVDSVGAPILLQQPYDARIMNPACLKTGGSRRSKRSRQSRKSLSRKKNRKSSR